MRRPLSPFWVLCFVWGCASGSQASPSIAEGPSDGDVEMVVQNDRQVRLTVFVRWDERRPVRLGEVEAGDTSTFFVGARGRLVEVLDEAMNAERGRPGRPSGRPQDVRPGDRLLWVLQPGGLVHSVRLPRN